MSTAPAVVLVRPSEEGNVGAVARAMANTGLERLLLVEPATEIGAKARARAVGAGEVLDGAERFASLEEALADFRHVVGTSSHRERALRSRTIEPAGLAARIGGDDPSRVALVFGPERSGLTTEELAVCGTIVRIPTARRQPTLNLAQAVLLVAHQLFVDREEVQGEEGARRRATAAEVAGLFEHADAVLREAGFARDSTYSGVLLDLRRLAARARLTEREVVILRGLCRRLEHALSGSRPAGKARQEGPGRSKSP